MRSWSTTVRALPWVMVLCLAGCPSTGSSTDAATDRGLMDLPAFDDLAEGDRDPTSDAVTVSDSPDTGPCVAGQTRSCACGDASVGGTVCTDAGVFATCDCSGRPPVLPPRLLAPQSVSRATTQRPTFRWVLPDGVARARVTLARDRALTREARSETVTGTSWRPAEALAFGVWFWRVEGLGDDGGTTWTSATWEFRAPRRDTPVDSSWGTLRDFNGDGYDDLVAVDNFHEGGALFYLLYGHSYGLSENPDRFAVPDTLDAQSDGIPRCGDFNGDGFADIAVATYPLNFAVDPAATNGVLDIYYGNRDGLTNTSRTRIRGNRSNESWEFFGTILARDFDGDGFTDLALGLTSYMPQVAEDAQIEIYWGSASGVSNRVSSNLGQSQAAIAQVIGDVGDLDGDGYGDIASRWRWNPPNGMDVASFFVRGTPRNSPLIGRMNVTPWRDFGNSFGLGGDVDGNGSQDLLVGSSNRADIFYDASSLLSATPGQTLSPPELPSGVGRLYGIAVYSPTDVNGDGYSDVLVAAPEARGLQGSLYLYEGGSRGVSSMPSHQWSGSDFGGRLLADHVGSGLDINGDGFDDIIMESVNSRLASPFALDVFLGSSDTISANPNQIIPNYRGLLSW